MGTLLVTVAYGPRRRDLAVRSDVPIADLLVPLADAFAVEPAPPGPEPGDLRSRRTQGRDAGGPGDLRTRTPGRDPAVGLGLAPLCGAVLPVERSLAACGIGHGAVLVLVDGDAALAGAVGSAPRR